MAADSERSSQASNGKEGLASRIRQTLHFTEISPRKYGKSINESIDLRFLNPRSQALLVRMVETIRYEESKNVVKTLDESRHLLRDSYDEFKREQVECRKELEKIIKEKKINRARQKENSIPLSLLLRQKHPSNTSDDLDKSTEDSETMSSDRAAVMKYLRSRERRRQAEENRRNTALTEKEIEQETAILFGNLEEADMKIENERRRQNERFRKKIQEKNDKGKKLIEVNEILDDALEAKNARDRLEQIHRDKIEARLSAARRSSTVNNGQSQNRQDNLKVKKERNPKEKSSNGRMTTEYQDTALTKIDI